MSAPRRVDVAVVGAGIVGLATADALRRRGASVACLDGGAPGHGQSAGAARGFRHLHADPALTRLAVRSRAGWRRLEERAGVALLERGGVLRLGGDHEADAAALRAAGLAPRVLGRAEAQPYLPWLAADAEPLLLDPDGGSLRAPAALAALTELVGDALVRARVTALEPLPGAGAVRLRTTAGTVECGRCVLCAGAGTERLVAPLGLQIARERHAHLRLTFAVAERAPGPIAVWSDRSGRYGAGAYGTPEGAGRYAIGLTVADYPAVEDPLAETVPGGVDLRAARARLRRYVRAALPGLVPEPVDAVLRLTTTLRGRPSDAFGLWRHDAVLAFAGHNVFKHAPALGELVAGAALGEPPDPLLRPEPAG